jgi:hypothetical protein
MMPAICSRRPSGAHPFIITAAGYRPPTNPSDDPLLRHHGLDASYTEIQFDFVLHKPVVGAEYPAQLCTGITEATPLDGQNIVNELVYPHSIAL